MPKREAAAAAGPATKRTRAPRASARASEDQGEPPAATAEAPAPAPAKRGAAPPSEAAAASPAAPSGVDHVAPSWVPRNPQLPSGTLHWDACASDCVRVAIWNITSLKSSDAKGLMRYLRAEDADVVILSETKVNAEPSHAGIDAMYRYRYWGIGEKKGYAGVALLSKIKPQSVVYGLPGFDDPSSRARMITAEFERTVVVGTYAVNAGDNLKTLDNKVRWNTALLAHLQSLPADKDIVWAGDLNVVWDDRDLAGASKKWNKSAGYTQAECDGHRHVLATARMTDAWRALHPDAVGHYTYYGWRGNCRARGAGWRIDSFIVRAWLTPGVGPRARPRAPLRDPPRDLRRQRSRPGRTCYHAHSGGGPCRTAVTGEASDTRRRRLLSTGCCGHARGGQGGANACGGGHCTCQTRGAATRGSGARACPTTRRRTRRARRAAPQTSPPQ